ncbi:MFS transporter [Caulobacter endophyticus]|uniref:MFS transporter n=1 Tax=Caulobacter endophyticus TaxID=2172652 RepID=UPI00240F3BA9|nr:MFS transporter [Caulobacter endophyticus]MDG2530923.1 MFS transporter [Caulobacter endophyticus]
MIDETDHDAESSAAGWRAVALLCAALLLSLTDRLIINLVVDPIRSDLRLTDFDVSLLQGAGFAVIFALAGLPAGRLADRVNRRNLIAGGLALWSAATIACGLAGDFWSFLSARVAVGLGEAALVPAAASFIIDCFSPRRRGLALGVFSLGATFGAGGALFIGGVLLGWIQAGWFAWAPGIAALAPWRQLLVLAGAPGFVLLPLLFLIREPVRRHSAGLIAVSAVLGRLIADNAMVLRVCLVKGALGVGDYALIAWLPALLQRGHGMTSLEAGGLVGLSLTASGVVASLAGGALSDRFARRWGAPSRTALLLACYLLALVGAISTLAAQTGGQIALAFAVWALGSISGYVIGHVVMQESVPNEMRATTVALSLAVTALVGIGLGPTLVPLVAERVFSGEAALQSAMGVISLGAALVALLVIWPPAVERLVALRTSGPARSD